MNDLSTLIPTLGAGGTTAGFAVDLLKILACAGFVAAVLGRLKVAVIPGYLIAGAIIGPGALGLVADSERIDEITSVATVLLMFGIGLHLDTSVLRRGTTTIIVAGVLTTLGTVFLITPVAMVCGLEPPAAIAVGMALSMSSTAVVLRLVQQRREFFLAHGRLSFGILLVQDLLVVVMLATLPAVATMGKGPGELHGSPAAIEMAAGVSETSMIAGSPPLVVALGVVAAMLVLGKLLLPRLMATVARGRSDEVLLVVAAAVALGAAVLTGVVGLSPELGAFLAGFLLSSTPFRYHLSGQIAPMRDLFMAVFFTAIGLELDLVNVAPDWWVVLVGAAALLAIKTMVIAAVSWAAGATLAVSVRSGMTLAQGGEFSLLLIATASGLGLLAQREESVLIAVIVATLLVTPMLMGVGGRVAGWVVHLPTAPWIGPAALGAMPGDPRGGDEDPDLPGVASRPCQVVVAGFGPIGRACVERLERDQIRSTIIELNPQTVRRQVGLGRSIIYGDATIPDVLERAAISQAQAVVLTMADHEAMLRAVSVIRRLHPDIYIAARADLVSTALRAKELGSNFVAIAELAAAEKLAEHALTGLGEMIRSDDAGS